LIILHRADVDEVIAYRKGDHSASESRQHMESNIGGGLFGDHLKHFRRADHQSGERPIAGRGGGLFHEPFDDSIWIGGHNATAAGIRDLVDAKSRCRSAVAVHSQHAFEVGAVENVRIEHPEKIIGADPVTVRAQGSGAAQQLRFFHDAYRGGSHILSQEFAHRCGMGMEINHDFVDP